LEQLTLLAVRLAHTMIWPISLPVSHALLVITAWPTPQHTSLRLVLVEHIARVARSTPTSTHVHPALTTTSH
jgi:hypothetical protein